jgi:hypothetical protein
VAGGWCYLDECSETVVDHTKNGLPKLEKGFDILRKTGTLEQAQSKFKAPSRFTPEQTKFAAEIAAKAPCIQGKVVIVPVHPQPTISELKAQYAAQNVLRVAKFANSLEGFRSNENLANNLAGDADRLAHKVQVLEAFVQRKSMSKTLQAQLLAKKPIEKAQLKAKRQLIADKVSKIEEALVDQKARPKSTWADIRMRVSKIPTVIITKVLPSIHDGDNYNSTMYPLQLTPKQMHLKEQSETSLSKKHEDQAEAEAAAIEEKLGDAPAPAKPVDPMAELNKYEKLMHESEGGTQPQASVDSFIPRPKELI